MPTQGESIRAALGSATQAYQGAVDDFDREVARRLGVNETDLRCLELLLSAGQATPRQLGQWLGLTTGSVTAMIDRLERKNYLTRSPHPSDRRSTLVKATPVVDREASALMTPFVDDATAQVFDRYSDDELRLVVDFLTFLGGIQERHTQRLREVPTRKRPLRSSGKRLPVSSAQPEDAASRSSADHVRRHPTRKDPDS